MTKGTTSPKSGAKHFEQTSNKKGKAESKNPTPATTTVAANATKKTPTVNSDKSKKILSPCQQPGSCSTGTCHNHKTGRSQDFPSQPIAAADSNFKKHNNPHDERNLQRAIQLSKEHMLLGHGGPFGAVIADSRTGEIVAEGWNLVTTSNDPTAHAEVTVIRRACAKLNKFQLDGCTLFTSCYPCPLCFAAAYWARVDRIVYANTAAEAASIGFDDQFIYDEIAKNPLERTIPFEHEARKEAEDVFEMWRNKKDKIKY